MWHHGLKPVWPGRRARERFTHTPITDWLPTRRSSASHKSFLEDSRSAPPGAPHLPPGLSSSARRLSGPVRPHLEERTQSAFQRATPPRAPRSPVTFSTWPCRSGHQHKQASGRAQLGLRPVSGTGAPVGPITTGWRAANPGAARSRPLAAEAPGSGWGRGERGAQARSPRPAGFARGPRHAPRARSTWPRAAECAPDPGDPEAAGRAGPRLRELRASLSGRPDAPTAGLDARACLSAFGGQSPAGGRPEVHGAFSVPQPQACRAPAESGDETLPARAAGTTRRAEPELRQTRRTSKPRAVNPQHQAPTTPGARLDPATGQPRPQLLFVRIASGAAAHTVLPGSRGGRPSSPRRAVPSLSVSSPTARGLASSTAKPGTAGELLKLGGCCRRTLPGGRLPPPSLRAPRAKTFTPPRRQSTSRSADPLPDSALSELSPDKPSRTQCKARNEAARLRTKSSAAGGRSLRSRHFPQPARALTRAPPQALPIPNALEFQSYFRAPCGLTTPSPAPLLLPPFRPLTNKFQEPYNTRHPSPSAPAPAPRGPEGAGPTPRRASRLPPRFPPPPLHTKEWAAWGPRQGARGVSAGGRDSGFGAAQPPRARAKHRSGGSSARAPKGRAASNLTLVVISELVSTAASDMMGHAGDPMQRIKKARVRGLWRESCLSPRWRRRRAAEVVAANGEPDTGTMQRWLFRAASGELTRRQNL
ncbi:PREDICTED: uncharacterized protein LOC101385063 [Odobenus rosmarus divergens]|uniref:Uncharacterized protein LOC101385063 n=1 Tax=Odobenus rosmarus divergens TaxID=9708 RepID=A0A9B0GAY1_ODORO